MQQKKSRYSNMLLSGIEILLIKDDLFLLFDRSSTNILL